MSSKFIGITAPMQHGKTELKPVFESMGWTFVDVNTFQNSLRVKGTERYNFYNTLLPGCLADDGSETDVYYQEVTLDLRKKTIPSEIPLVAQTVRDYCQQVPAGSKVLLSWELFPAILGEVYFDHFLVFWQPKEVWYAKMRKRARELGIEKEFSNEDFEYLAILMDVESEYILGKVKIFYPLNHTIVDVSSNDWGEAQIKEILPALS